ESDVRTDGGNPGFTLAGRSARRNPPAASRQGPWGRGGQDGRGNFGVPDRLERGGRDGRVDRGGPGGDGGRRLADGAGVEPADRLEGEGVVGVQFERLAIGVAGLVGAAGRGEDVGEVRLRRRRAAGA